MHISLHMAGSVGKSCLPNFQAIGSVIMEFGHFNLVCYSNGSGISRQGSSEIWGSGVRQWSPEIFIQFIKIRGNFGRFWAWHKQLLLLHHWLIFAMVTSISDRWWLLMNDTTAVVTTAAAAAAAAWRQQQTNAQLRLLADTSTCWTRSPTIADNRRYACAGVTWFL